MNDLVRREGLGTDAVGGNLTKLDDRGRWHVLSKLLEEQGLYAAVELALEFVKGDRGNPYNHYHLALLRAQIDEQAALDEFLEEADKRRSDPLFCHAAGKLLNELARHSEAMRYMERPVATRGSMANLINPFVFSSLYVEDLDPVESRIRLEQLVRRHFGESHRQQLHRPGKPRYLIGFVTATLNHHALVFFLEPLLRNLDRKKFMVLIFSSETKSGVYFEHMQSLADVFFDVRSMSDAALLDLIRSERVDVLIDLDHHTNDNRLGVFARRAAPIQITMYGLHATTAIGAMDYRISDYRIDPVGSERDYTEVLLRTDRAHFAHSLLAPVVEVDVVPEERNGFFTFGSFNNWKKINARIVKSWASLLKVVAGSRLLVVGFDDVLGQRRLQQWLGAEGIDLTRVEVHGRVSTAELHRLVQRTDLALDSWPYGGGVTTAMILELGVPVATVEGDRAVSRMGAAMLWDVGLEELIAKSPEELVGRIVNLIGRKGDFMALRLKMAAAYARTIGDGKACADAVSNLILHAIARCQNGLPAAPN